MVTRWEPGRRICDGRVGCHDEIIGSVRTPRLRCDRLAAECDGRKALFVEALREGARIEEACRLVGWSSRGCYTMAMKRDRRFAVEADRAKLTGWRVRFDQWDGVSARSAVHDPVPPLPRRAADFGVT